VILVTAVLAGGLVVPFASNLKLASPLLKLSWRQTTALPFGLLVAGFELYFVKDFKFSTIATTKNLLSFLFVGIMGNLMSFGYIWSAEYTIMSHASIFNSLGGGFIVIYRLLMKKQVHKLEILGTLISLMGCTIVLFDKGAEKVDSEH
jgi:hypothetical protein